MTGSHKSAGERATCPFCGAAWSDAMLAQLDRSTVPSGCACCGGVPSQHIVAATPESEDICCAACGRAIYRGVAAKQGSIA